MSKPTAKYQMVKGEQKIINEFVPVRDECEGKAGKSEKIEQNCLNLDLLRCVSEHERICSTLFLKTEREKVFRTEIV